VFGCFAHEVIVVKVRLALVPFGAEVSLVGSKLLIGVLSCLGKLYIVVLSDFLKVSFKGARGDSELSIEGSLSFIDHALSGIPFGIKA